MVIVWRELILIFEVFVLPIIVITVCLISAKIYKRQEKVDKGFAINYFKLSYRRRVIRDLINLPLLIICSIIFYYLSDWSFKIFITFSVIILLCYALQLLYNYKMWKKGM